MVTDNDISMTNAKTMTESLKLKHHNELIIRDLLAYIYECIIITHIIIMLRRSLPDP
jgi:hypothetical protein